MNGSTPSAAITGRVIGYDVARALALFGMVVVNFKIVMGLDAGGGHPLLDLAALLEGRAAALFVVLAGIGVSLASRSARERGDAASLSNTRTALLKRASFLFVVGLLYTPLWPADILHFYGLYITVGVLLLAAPTRRLWLAAGLFTAMFVVLVLVLDYERGWDWDTLAYEGLWTPLGMVRHLLFNGFHPVFPWTAFLLVGMALGRLDLSVRSVRARVFAWGLAAVVVAEGASALLVSGLSAGASVSDREIIEALFGTAPMPPMPLYVVAGAGGAAVMVALCVALTSRYEDSRLWKVLVPTGQLALTLYVAHVVVGMGVLSAVGRLEGQSVGFGLGSAATFYLSSVAFAYVWRRAFERGPLEALMRRLTRPGTAMRGGMVANER